jgi:hypothetical protein
MEKIIDNINNAFIKENEYNYDIFNIEIDKNIILLDGKYYNKISDKDLNIIETMNEELIDKLKQLFKNYCAFVKKYIKNEYDIAFQLECEISSISKKVYNKILENTEYNYKKINRIWQLNC